MLKYVVVARLWWEKRKKSDKKRENSRDVQSACRTFTHWLNNVSMNKKEKNLKNPVAQSHPKGLRNWNTSRRLICHWTWVFKNICCGCRCCWAVTYMIFVDIKLNYGRLPILKVVKWKTNWASEDEGEKSVSLRNVQKLDFVQTCNILRYWHEIQLRATYASNPDSAKIREWKSSSFGAHSSESLCGQQQQCHLKFFSSVFLIRVVLLYACSETGRDFVFRDYKSKPSIESSIHSLRKRSKITERRLWIIWIRHGVTNIKD